MSVWTLKHLIYVNGKLVIFNFNIPFLFFLGDVYDEFKQKGEITEVSEAKQAHIINSVPTLILFLRCGAPCALRKQTVWTFPSTLSMTEGSSFMMAGWLKPLNWRIRQSRISSDCWLCATLSCQRRRMKVNWAHNPEVKHQQL